MFISRSCFGIYFSSLKGHEVLGRTASSSKELNMGNLKGLCVGKQTVMNRIHSARDRDGTWKQANMVRYLGRY